MILTHNSSSTTTDLSLFLLIMCARSSSSSSLSSSPIQSHPTTTPPPHHWDSLFCRSRRDNIQSRAQEGQSFGRRNLRMCPRTTVLLGEGRERLERSLDGGTQRPLSTIETCPQQHREGSVERGTLAGRSLDFGVCDTRAPGGGLRTCTVGAIRYTLYDD